MIDFLRNLSKPATERRQERLNAYLDGALSAREQRQFETELERDAALRAELEDLRWVKLSLRRAPRMRAPRNFILDPAVYGQQARARSAWSPYPGLRVATALAAFFFILALALDLATPNGALNGPMLGSQGVSEVAMEESARQADDAALFAIPDDAMSDTAEAEEDELASAREPLLDVTEDGAGLAEMAPLATVVGDVAGAAEEAAAEIVEESPAAVAPAAPEAGERVTEEPVVDGEADMTALEAPMAQDSAAEEIALQESAEESAAPATRFPALLVIEIVLGAALILLTVLTLLARRGA